MRKKLLAGLLALCVLLALAPAAAFAEGDADYISSVKFWYKNPSVLPADDDHNALAAMRNVVYVAVAQGKAEDYTYQLRKDGGDYEDVPQEKVKYNKSGNVAYFETDMPTDPSADVNEISVKATNEADGTASEKSCDVVRLTIHKEGGTLNDEALDAAGDDVAVYIMPNVNYSYHYLPKMMNRDLGPGNFDNIFLGWTTIAQGGSERALMGSSPEEDTDLYPVFGAGKVERLLVVENPEDTESNLYPEIKAAYGNAQAVKTLYIKNGGNQQITGVTLGASRYFDVELAEKNGAYFDGRYYVLPNFGDCVEVTLTLKSEYKDLAIGTYSDSMMVFNSTSFKCYIMPKIQVAPVEVTIAPNAVTKEYGKAIASGEAGFTVVSPHQGPAPEELGVILDSDGFSGTAPVGTYDIFIDSWTARNYDVRLAEGEGEGKVTVEKATLINEDVSASVLKAGDPLSKSVLSGTAINPNNNQIVSGQFVWTDDVDSMTAGEHQQSWKFIPAENPEYYNELTGTVTVNVTSKEITLVRLQSGQSGEQKVEYNGQHHALQFVAERGGQVITQGITVEYFLGEQKLEGAPRDAGTYIVKASIPEDETYAGDDETVTLIIDQRVINATATVANREYNGVDDVSATIQSITINNKAENDDVAAEGTAHFYDGGGAGKDKTVHIDITQLTGADAKNYAIPTETHIHTTATITPKKLNIVQRRTVEKPYGSDYVFNVSRDFTFDGFVKGESLNNSGVTLEVYCDGKDMEAEVGEYDVTCKLTGGNYTAGSVSMQKLRVVKAAPVLKNEPTTATGKAGWTLSKVHIHDGVYVNSSNESLKVAGIWAWAQPDTLLEEGENQCGWVFTLTDTDHYEIPEVTTGTLTVTAVSKTPVAIHHENEETVPYDGEAHSLSFTTEPEGATVIVTYDGSEEAPVNAGTYAVAVTATPTQEYEDDYTEGRAEFNFTITAVHPTFSGNEPVSALENTLLGDITPEIVFTGVDGETVEGSFQWTHPETTVTLETGEYGWTFTPDSGNYLPVSGFTTVNMADDTRTVSAVVFNLPEDLGFHDYAVVDVEESALRVNDVVQFYSDETCTEPIGEALRITASDVAEGGRLHVRLDSNALVDHLGDAATTIYVKINGTKTKVTPVSVPVELGLTVDKTAVHVIPVEGSDTATVTAAPTGDYTAAYSWTVDVGEEFVVLTNASSAAVTVRGLRGTEAILTVTATFDHPDSAKSEKITVSKTVSLSVSGLYSVILGEISHGTVTASPTEGLAGTEVTLTVTPDRGYEPDTLTVTKNDGANTPVAVTDNKFTLTDSDVTVNATFKALPVYNVTFADTENGTVSASQASGYAGDVITLTVTPDEGYELETLTVTQNDEAGTLIAVKDNTFTMPESDVTVTAVFKSTAVTPPAPPSGGGSTAPSDTVRVPEKPENGQVEISDRYARAGQTVTVTPKPEPGYRVGKVTVTDAAGNAVEVTENADGTYSFVMPKAAPVSVKVEFEKIAAADMFPDLARSEWYTEAVDYTVARSIFKGKEDGLFHPEGITTRAEVMTILARLEGEDVDGGQPWYEKAMNWAVEAGVSDGTNPTEVITREQVVTMFWRAAGMPASEKSLEDFGDAASVSSWAQDAFRWAVDKGVLQGKPGGLLDPQGTCTRAELAKIVMVICTM